MRKTFVSAAAVALLAFSGSAFAQDTVIVQDPVTTQSTVVVPGEVRTYVLEQQVPSVAYDGDVVVGAVVPDTVEIHTIDGHADYAYSVVNDQRVIINPQTRTIVQVVE